jgi:hypothetical protein
MERVEELQVATHAGDSSPACSLNVGVPLLHVRKRNIYIIITHPKKAPQKSNVKGFEAF